MSWQEEINGLVAKHGDQLTPAQVLAYARDPSTALHEQFEWNNETAGERYRLVHARDLIRRVVVHIDQGVGHKPLKVRALVNVDRGSRAYVPIAVVRQSDESTQKVIHQLLLDLESAKRRLLSHAAALNAPDDLQRAIDAFIAQNAPPQEERASA